MSELKVIVSGEDYKLCANAYKNMSCSQKTGEWRSGMNNTALDPRGVERTGRLGEMALARILGLTIDLKYYKNGDSFDLNYYGSTIDVKTSFKRPWFEAGLIRAVTAEKHKLELKAQLYVFAYLISDNKKDSAKISLVGYIPKEEVLVYPYVSARKANMHHLNYEIPYSDLYPIEVLIEKSSSLSGR